MDETSYPAEFKPFELLLFNTIKHKNRLVIITAIAAAPLLTYVGTNEGYVIAYDYQVVDELFQVKRRKTVQLGEAGISVEKLVVVPEFASVLVLTSDGQLSILNMYSLEVAVKIPKEVGTTEATVKAIGQLMRFTGKDRVLNFCVQYPRQLFRVCCQVKGALLFFEILGSKNEYPTPFLTIPLIEQHQGSQIIWTGRKCFIGTAREYIQLEIPTTQYQLNNPKPPTMLFQLSDNSHPAFVYTGDDILLLSGRVGVFVDFEGRITRGSVTWSAEPISVTFNNPYIVALLPTRVIEVHSIYNLQVVQTLPYSQRFRSISEGELALLSTGDQIYCAVQQPIEKQLDMLMEQKCISEAVKLAKNFWKNEPQKLHNFYGKVGFMWFVVGRWNDAIPMLVGSATIDLREIISLFPDLLPASGTPGYTRVFNVAFAEDINYTHAKQALLHLLEAKRSRTMVPPLLQCTDTALMKLYLEMGSNKLDEFMSTASVKYEDAEPALMEHYALKQLAKLYKQANEPEKALDVIKRIDLEEIIRTGYDPLDDAIDILVKAGNKELILDNAKWILDRDINRGIKLFTTPSEHQVSFNTDEILQFLNQYGRVPQIEFLEHLIFNMGVTDEALHTQMGIYCIDLLQANNQAPAKARRRTTRIRETKVVEGAVDPIILQRVQNKLLRLVKYSDYYNVSTLLGRIRSDSLLYDESVILYGRLGQHKKALDILVNEKQDFEAADAYCAEHNEENLFSDLLRLYLDPNDISTYSVIPENAFRLLNSRATSLDALEVLKMLPNDTPLHIVERFIRRAYQYQLGEKRMKLVETNLCRMERIQVKTKLLSTQSKHVTISRGVNCGVCNKPINDSVFATFPNDVIVHFKCFEDDHICPITKRNFLLQPVDL